MAESQDDKDVDSAIARMQALLDELKGAQRKDVQDESGEDENAEQPKTLAEARTRVRSHFRRLRAAKASPQEQ